jgi:conjugal transfer pilus assembly protein TraB
VLACYFVQNSGDAVKSYKSSSGSKKDLKIPDKTVPGIEGLTNGVNNEILWAEQEGKEVESVKQKQFEQEQMQKSINERLEQNKISKEELENIIGKLQAEMEEKNNKRLEEELSKLRANYEEQKKTIDNNLESRSFFKKKKIRKVGEYIPANSYAQGKLLLGVDAGVGMSAEANPRQVLLRITGDAISAGFGSEYLKTNKLIGCQMSARAVGDISSEKVYLDGVLMTCAKDSNSFMEIPVKAYITSMAKSGIRGEVISRDGDLVLKSFLSGLAGGFGSSVNTLSQPQSIVSSSGFAVTDQQKVKNIVQGSVGSGLSTGGDKLSEYFIKRAEQYQPVISVNEGVEVYVVFQEGFSFKEEDSDDKKSK